MNQKIDIIVNAADTPDMIENIVHEFGFLHGNSTVSCSVGRNYGTWGPLYMPKKTCCYHCFNKYEENEMSKYEKFISSLKIEPMEAAFGPINSIVSNFMAKDILLFLALRSNNEKIASVNCRCGVNFDTLEFFRSNFNKIYCNCWKGE